MLWGAYAQRKRALIEAGARGPPCADRQPSVAAVGPAPAVPFVGVATFDKPTNGYRSTEWTPSTGWHFSVQTRTTPLLTECPDAHHPAVKMGTLALTIPPRTYPS